MPQNTLPKYCGIDETELPPHLMTNRLCKCHNAPVHVYCLDCNKYIAYFSWSSHVTQYPNHKRRTFEDLEDIEIIDLNADPEEATTHKKRKKVVMNGYCYFMKTMGKQGKAKKELFTAYNMLSQEEKDQYATAAYYSLDSDTEEKSAHDKEMATNENSSTFLEEQVHNNTQYLESRTKKIGKNSNVSRKNGFHEYCSSQEKSLTISASRASWSKLTHEERKVFTERALQYNASVRKGFTSDDENSADSTQEESDDCSEDESPKKKKRNGYIMYTIANAGKGLSKKELGTAWRSLSEQEKSSYATTHDKEPSQPKKKRTSWTNGYLQYVTTTMSPGKSMKEVAEGWKALSQDEKDVYYEKARHATLNVWHRKRSLSKIDTHHDEEFSDDEDCQSEEERSEEPPKKRARKYNGYNGFQIFQMQSKGSGLSVSQLALSHEVRSRFNETARRRLAGESTKESVVEVPIMLLSDLEESTIRLSLLICAEKATYISRHQFEKLQYIITTPNHHLHSTVSFITSLVKEHLEKKHNKERWKEVGLPLVQNVLLLLNK